MPNSSARWSSSCRGISDICRGGSVVGVIPVAPTFGGGTAGVAVATGAGAGGPSTVPPPVAPGSIFISPGLPVPACIVSECPDPDEPVQPPGQQEHDAEQEADQHVAPERREPQSQAMDNHVPSQQADVPVAARQPDPPAPQRLDCQHRR